MSKKDDSRHAMIAEEDDNYYDFFAGAVDKVSMKITLTRAEDGEILINLLNKSTINPDVLFLNLLLPLTNGRDCLKLIRANKKFDFMPVIIYSSLQEDQSIEFCYRERANLFVFKPKTIEELTDILERIFTLRWSKLMYYPAFHDFVMNPKNSPEGNQNTVDN